jgi:uncharacterized protein
MALFYLDTSAVLKRYRTENGTEVIDALIEAVPRLKLYTSHFTCLEVESVAARILKGKSLIDYAYSTLLGSFGRDLREFISLESLNGDVLNAAIEVTRATRLRPADSIQLAAARAIRVIDEAEELVIVASDKELLAAAEAAGIATLNPESADAMDVLASRIR